MDPINVTYGHGALELRGAGFVQIMEIGILAEVIDILPWCTDTFAIEQTSDSDRQGPTRLIRDVYIRTQTP